jgi:uncharacterized membrane protein
MMELSLHPAVVDILSGASGASLQCVLLFIFSMLPITECRLTIPFGILVFGLPWYLVLPVCVISNSIIGVFLIFALDWLINIFSKISFFNAIIDRLLLSSKSKYQRYNRFKSSGLLLFVGIPLPGTGAWTGALVSYVIGLHKGISMISIIQGVILSGIIMTILSLTGKAIVL